MMGAASASQHRLANEAPRSHHGTATTAASPQLNQNSNPSPAPHSMWSSAPRASTELEGGGAAGASAAGLPLMSSMPAQSTEWISTLSRPLRLPVNIK
jgi:hypothetical protein